MTAADTLRRAATMLRQAAEQATPGPWTTTGRADRYGGLVAEHVPCDVDEYDGYGGTLVAETLSRANREYMQLVDPTVGLALADWLDAEAAVITPNTQEFYSEALVVARAILREGDEQP